MKKTKEQLNEVALPDVSRMSKQDVDKLVMTLAKKPQKILKAKQNELIARIKKFIQAGKKDAAAEDQAKQKVLARALGKAVTFGGGTGRAEIEWKSPFESVQGSLFGSFLSESARSEDYWADLMDTV